MKEKTNEPVRFFFAEHKPEKRREDGPVRRSAQELTLKHSRSNLTLLLFNARMRTKFDTLKEHMRTKQAGDRRNFKQSFYMESSDWSLQLATSPKPPHWSL